LPVAVATAAAAAGAAVSIDFPLLHHPAQANLAGRCCQNWLSKLKSDH
jgi:hypothetical protein